MEPKKEKELGQYEIGRGKYVVVSNYKGEVLTHIRTYEQAKDSARTYPTKFGIVLRPTGFANLLLLRDDITEILQRVLDGENISLHKHISNGTYVSITPDFKLVNLRKYFLPADTNVPVPTRSGICLSRKEWMDFITVSNIISNDVKELKEALPYVCTDVHYNQLGYYSCAYCNPFNIVP